MRSLLIAAVLSAALAAPAMAQIPMSQAHLYYVPSVPARIEAMPRDLPRARGPSLKYALDLAKAAVEACKAKKEPVSVQVADSVGVPVVILSGDGAGERSQLITYVKVAVVATYRKPADEVSKMAKADPKLAAEIRGNPSIDTIRGPGFMLKDGDEFIGVLAVSGAPGTDGVCAMEALSKVPPPGPPATVAAAPARAPAK